MKTTSPYPLVYRQPSIQRKSQTLWFALSQTLWLVLLNLMTTRWMTTTTMTKSKNSTRTSRTGSRRSNRWRDKNLRSFRSQLRRRERTRTGLRRSRRCSLGVRAQPRNPVTPLSNQTQASPSLKRTVEAVMVKRAVAILENESPRHKNRGWREQLDFLLLILNYLIMELS